MGGRAREGNRREPTGQTGEAAPPARGPAGEQQSAETQPSVVETWQARVFRRNPNPTNPPIPNSWPRRRSPGPEAFPSSEVRCREHGSAPFPARPLSCASPGQLCPRDRASGSKGERRRGRPKAPCNWNFSHLARRHSVANTNRHRAARARGTAPPPRRSSPTTAPAGPVLPERPTKDPGAARSRPLAAEAPGSCGGGEVAARRRAPPPGALCAGLGTHRARGARGPGPPSAPLTLETWSPRTALAPPIACELLASLPGPLDAPPSRPRCAGLRSCIWRAKSRGRPPRSPRGSCESRSPWLAETRSTGLFTAPSGKSPRRKANARAGEDRPSPSN